ncbi:hypothetical protein INT46_006271 [Mucor plumbeus]|uniref:Uncharacterized protein n=1 Tax=Mucor plumbeus TaxID=97098 RepID=A0A8H7V858_9FUNG|nr:hypothetical protein INT46_006271 [Mucor plumbeus]
MSDLNWCTFCDNALSPFSKLLYCSDQCLKADALRNHPLLGYKYPECTNFFARRSSTTTLTNGRHRLPPGIFYTRQKNPNSNTQSLNNSLILPSSKN